MPDPAKPSCCSRCRDGYWNAIAYGATAATAAFVAMAFLSTITTQPSFRIDDISDNVGEAMFWFLGNLHSLSRVLLGFVDWFGVNLDLSGHRSGVQFLLIGLYISLQWIVFLAALRLYWWRRRAPVTGRSALTAIAVMAAVIVGSYLLRRHLGLMHW